MELSLKPLENMFKSEVIYTTSGFEAISSLSSIKNGISYSSNNTLTMSL